MRALTVTALTGPDGVSVTEQPAPAAGDRVLVEVHAAGLSFPDLLRSQGAYQDRSEPPFVLGGEFAGVVVSAPAGSGFAAGQRVAGIVPGGGAAAELVAAPAAGLLELPEALSFEQGAGLILNYETAILALEVRGRMRAGETVLVHGAAGGTGTAALQVARGLGGETIAVVSDDGKAEVARAAGAGHVLRSDQAWKDEALRLTGGRGVDLVFDPVGGDRMLDTLRALAPAGRWLVIGFVGGEIPQVPLNRVLLRNVDVVGAYYGGWVSGQPAAVPGLRRRLLELIEAGHVRPLIGRPRPLAEGAEALREMAERRATGKLVLQVRPA